MGQNGKGKMEEEHAELKCDCSLCQELKTEDFWTGLNCVLDMLAKLFQIIVHQQNVNAHNATVLALQDLIEWAHAEMNGEERIVH